MSTSTRLDALVERARTVEVRPEHAAQRVAELDRRAREAQRGGWLGRFGIGVGLAAAAAIALVLAWWTRPRGEPAIARDPVRIGDRVAVLAEPGTAYRIATGSADATEIDVERGAVTARLWSGKRAHRLALRGGGVTATATGTVYSLAVDERGARVHVHEGAVEVITSDGHRTVVEGGGWSTSSVAGGAGEAAFAVDAAARLLALAAPSPSPSPESPSPSPLASPSPPPTTPTSVDSAAPDADGPSDADPSGADPRRPERHASSAGSASPPSLRDRWRAVRLLRGQNKLDAAIAECVAITDARDATWSPIALVEAMRIELGPRASPERAIELADRMAREWPSHALAPEARSLRCRAMHQLGRGDDCAPAPTP